MEEDIQGRVQEEVEEERVSQESDHEVRDQRWQQGLNRPHHRKGGGGDCEEGGQWCDSAGPHSGTFRDNTYSLANIEPWVGVSGKVIDFSQGSVVFSSNVLALLLHEEDVYWVLAREERVKVG